MLFYDFFSVCILIFQDHGSSSCEEIVHCRDASRSVCVTKIYLISGFPLQNNSSTWVLFQKCSVLPRFYFEANEVRYQTRSFSTGLAWVSTVKQNKDIFFSEYSGEFKSQTSNKTTHNSEFEFFISASVLNTAHNSVLIIGIKVIIRLKNILLKV